MVVLEVGNLMHFGYYCGKRKFQFRSLKLLKAIIKTRKEEKKNNLYNLWRGK